MTAVTPALSMLSIPSMLSIVSMPAQRDKAVSSHRTPKLKNEDFPWLTHNGT